VRKSSGPDGLTGVFSRTFSQQLTSLFTPFFNQFLDGYLLPQEHKGVITTIYKGKGDPLEITKRGPIILLNIDYKLLSKVLNSRLLRFLPQVVAAN